MAWVWFLTRVVTNRRGMSYLLIQLYRVGRTDRPEWDSSYPSLTDSACIVNRTDSLICMVSIRASARLGLGMFRFFRSILFSIFTCPLGVVDHLMDVSSFRRIGSGGMSIRPSSNLCLIFHQSSSRRRGNLGMGDARATSTG